MLRRLPSKSSCTRLSDVWTCIVCCENFLNQLTLNRHQKRFHPAAVITYVAQKPNYNQGTSSSRDIFQRSCFICGKIGHLARDCRSKPRDASKIASVLASAITGLLGHEHDTESSPDKRPETIAHLLTMSDLAPLEKCCTQDGFATLKCGHALPVMTAACKNPEFHKYKT